MHAVGHPSVCSRVLLYRAEKHKAWPVNQSTPVPWCSIGEAYREKRKEGSNTTFSLVMSVVRWGLK